MTLADLNGHRDMVTQLHKARETLQVMQGKILSAQQYDGMPHAHNASRSTENTSISMQVAIDDVNRLERIVKRSEESGIRDWIMGIPDFYTKIIFSLRFLDGNTWEGVAASVSGRNTPESVKATCYRYLGIEDEQE